MLNATQISLLQAAANVPGRILQIFAAANALGDDDTLNYIAQNYFTTQHFSPHILAQLQQVMQEDTLH